MKCHASNSPRGELPGDVELTHAPHGATSRNPISILYIMSNSKTPATGTTFAKGITTSTIVDAVNARRDADRASFDAQWEEARQLGHVHRFAESTKKATGRTITDHLQPIAHASGVSIKTLQNRAGEGRKLIDAKGLTKARRDKLRKQLEADGKKVNVRNVIALHTGGKVEKKTVTKDEEKPTTGGPIRTTVDAKAPGSEVPATANLSDDVATAALEYQKIGIEIAKACNTEYSEFLRMAGLQELNPVTA